MERSLFLGQVPLRMGQAIPVAGSPFLPSLADVPGLPPKLDEMPIFNPGTRCYVCEDGQHRVLTQAQAINLGMSCRAVDPEECSAVPRGTWGVPMVAGFPVMNAGPVVYY